MMDIVRDVEMSISSNADSDMHLGLSYTSGSKYI